MTERHGSFDLGPRRQLCTPGEEFAGLEGPSACCWGLSGWPRTVPRRKVGRAVQALESAPTYTTAANDFRQILQATLCKLCRVAMLSCRRIEEPRVAADLDKNRNSLASSRCAGKLTITACQLNPVGLPVTREAQRPSATTFSE